MKNNIDFRVAYQKLERQMKTLAEDDGHVYLPNMEPEGPVDYILICMEPSMGRWASSTEKAKSKVEAGFKNFISSIETSILHYCVRHYLCEPLQRYHITDLSKGAMKVGQADNDRVQRYDKWYPLLEKELELVATAEAKFIAVGNAVSQHLVKEGFSKRFKPFTSIIHYSGLAAKARKDGILGHEVGFQAFKDTVLLEDLIANTKELLETAQLSAAIKNEALSELEKSQLTTSRLQLMFNYKVAFESMRLDVHRCI